MSLSAQEICDVAEELEKIARARKSYRRREMVSGRDYNEIGPIGPGSSGILLAFPGDLPCCPDAVPECLSVDVDYTVLVPDNADVATNSIERLSLRFEWSAAMHELESDIVRGTAGTFHGNRMIVRYNYARETVDTNITQPPVEIRATVVEGCTKASTTNMWNLRKTILVGDVPNASESNPQAIPRWANEAHLQTPGALTAGLTLILNQYTAPNGTLISSSTIGKGSGAGAPIVQGARYFTIVNLGPATILGVRVVFSLGQ